MIATKNLSLWQLGSEYQRLLSQLYDYETGEVNELVQAQLDALEPDTEKKCIAVQAYIRKLQSEQRELERLKDEIRERETAYEKEITKWNDYLFTGMKRAGIKEIKCPYFKIRIKQNPFSTDILDESQIPAEYMCTRDIVKTETKPDKNAIKEEVLRTGVQVPGALVTQKEKLEVIIDKI